ncbi:histone deacetylase [Burkholderiaceae bacterium FT117]|uniref:histone deacetylase family protein n=1 Tax=Zeimonas sediminis TaxID=2944268 RepID=UPI00234317F5|nr:histone deacetylase [Zeimonas sediminis]MCM5569758.1 histone deacetylase [Zeimonas sediminis]
MDAFYSDRFVLPLPAGHRFPMVKYERLRHRVAAALPGVRLLEPAAASDGVLALAHHPDWVARLTEGRLQADEIRAIGFPWSPGMVERSRRSAGASVEAARSALRDGAAVNLAGGTHHAGAARGEGFCCFNDLAIAARLMQAERRARRVAIVDLDVHQGNGTAEILARDDSVFTLSVHGERNYPFRKAVGDLDVALPDGTGDDAYLDALDRALGEMGRRFAPDLVLYLAGADVYEGDRLGRLSLTRAGILERDRRVFGFARRRGLPVAVAMGGGYCPSVDEIVEIHLATVGEAFRHAHGAPALRDAADTRPATSSTRDDIPTETR